MIRFFLKDGTEHTASSKEEAERLYGDRLPKAVIFEEIELKPETAVIHKTLHEYGRKTVRVRSELQ